MQHWSSMHKWGLTPNAACECAAEEQTADHVILECPMYEAPNGMHGLLSVDDDTVTWLLEVCPDIQLFLSFPKIKLRNFCLT